MGRRTWEGGDSILWKWDVAQKQKLSIRLNFRTISLRRHRSRKRANSKMIWIKCSSVLCAFWACYVQRHQNLIFVYYLCLNLTKPIIEHFGRSTLKIVVILRFQSREKDLWRKCPMVGFVRLGHIFRSERRFPQLSSSRYSIWYRSCIEIIIRNKSGLVREKFLSWNSGSPLFGNNLIVIFVNVHETYSWYTL